MKRLYSNSYRHLLNDCFEEVMDSYFLYIQGWLHITDDALEFLEELKRLHLAFGFEADSFEPGKNRFSGGYIHRRIFSVFFELEEGDICNEGLLGLKQRPEDFDYYGYVGSK